jgi:dipeptidyl aminopeptidase/acylaminoacyl peptidase
VAINAPTDLGAWINQQPELGNTEVMAPPESFRAAVRRAVFGADLPALKAMSPLTHAGEVQTPVLLIHGSSSRIVPPAHSVRMSNALRRAGAPVTHVELPGAGHANWRPGTSTRAFREIEMFVNENIYNYAVKIGELEIVP